jgi:hypothetical protein
MQAQPITTPATIAITKPLLAPHVDGQSTVGSPVQDKLTAKAYKSLI